MSKVALWQKLPLHVVALVVIQILFATTQASAQAVTWTQTDINSGSTGSFTYGAATPPTYTVTGSGAGPSGITDSMTFVGTPAVGTFTIQGQVVSQSNTGTGALAGICIRNSTQQDYAYSYMLAVTPGNGIIFYRRQQNGGNSTLATVAGTAPTYLKLTRDGSPTSGYTISAYHGQDGINWSLLYSDPENVNNPLPIRIYTGFVVSSTVNGATQSTAVFDHVSYMTSVPQQSADLLLWLRCDAGVTTSGGGAISQWTDQSGHSNHGTQSSGASKPTLSSGTVNSGILSGISFNGSSSYLTLPTGFADLSAGGSVFLVLKASSGVATGVPFVCGNTSNSDALIAKTVGTNAALYAYNSTTGSDATTTTNPISTSNYQLVEAIFTPGLSAGTGVGKVYVNGNLEKTATNLVQNLNNTSRASNLVGAGIGLTEYFGGEICEILFYANPVSDSFRHSIESYVLSKFGVGAMPTLDAPVIFPSSGVFLPQQKFVLTPSQNAVVHYTRNGATPTDSDLWFYTNQSWLLNISPEYIPRVQETTTIKAIAKAPFFNDSPVATAIYHVEPDTAPIPRNGLIQWLRGSNLVTSGSNVTTWTDISGSLNDFSNTANWPQLTSSAVNGEPAVSFSGSQFLQAPAGFSTFTSGLTALLVAKPTSVSAGARLFDYGNGATSDNIIMSLPSSTGLTFSTYNSSTSSSATASTGVSLGNFQLLEAAYNGTNTANLYVNGALAGTSSSMQTLNNLVRNNNHIGQDNSGGNRYNGQLAEMLIWNRALSSAERTAVEGFLQSKFQIPTSNSVVTPVFSVASTSFTEPSQVAISSPTGGKIFLTTDGSTPTTSSLEYTKPVFIMYSQTVKAIAVLNGISSSVVTNSYTLDATKWPAPSPSDTRPLDLKQQLPNVGIPHDANQP